MPRYPKGMDVHTLPGAYHSGRATTAQLEFTLNKLLKGAGAGVNPTEIDVPTSTKEFFVPAFVGTLGSIYGQYGDYPVIQSRADNNTVFFSFRVPLDFTAITNAVIVLIPRSTQAAARWDIESDYASNGEPYNTHSESDLASTYNVTNDAIFELNIALILSALAAGDYVGIKFTQQNDAHDCDILGIRFRYS